MQYAIIDNENRSNWHVNCYDRIPGNLNTSKTLPSTSMSQLLFVNPHGKRQLSPGFRPGPYDVICARGKATFEHEGNKRFRAIVHMHKNAYSNAATKYQKSQIVSHVTNNIRQASQGGGFVKMINGCWWEVGDRMAKEKIGQTFRDLLDQQYTSSTKAKARVRIQQRRVEDERSDSPQPVEQNTPKPGEHSEPVSSSASVVSSGSTSPKNRHPGVNRTTRIGIMPPQIDVLPKVESSLFDTFEQILDAPATASSDDLEPLPIDLFPAVMPY
jgi:hypothetical protein